MKKILTILGSVSLIATTSFSLVACAPEKEKEEPIKNLTQEQLQNKMDTLLTEMLELGERIKELEKDPNNLPKILELFDQFLKKTFQRYFLMARVYLETNYAAWIDGTILNPEDENEYQNFLKQFIPVFESEREETKSLIDSLNFGEKYEGYFNKWKDYQTQLEDKLTILIVN